MARSFALIAFFVLAFCFSSALARKPIDSSKESSVDTPIYRKRVESPKESPKKFRVDTPIYRKRVESPKKSRVDTPILNRKPVDSSILKRKAPHIEPFTVIGKIYCDPCRFEFVSRLSKPLEGVKVSLTCRKEDSNNATATYVKESKSDANGVYKILVDGDHEDEICEVEPEAARKGTCTEFMTNKSDRIVLTNNMGSSSLIRLVNPLGFKTKTVDNQCRQVVKELGLDKLDD